MHGLSLPAFYLTTCTFQEKRESAHFVLIDPTLSYFLLTGGGKLRPSRVQSVVSSQGSMDSDMQGKE